MEYKKNDRVTLTIEDMGSDGEGIGKVDGFTLFIKDAVIGDQVEAKIIKSKKHYAYARLEKVLQPSPFRVEPKCAYHRQCGGCQLQALSYSEQLHFKEQKIRNNLIRIGGFDAEYIDERMQPIVGMEEPFHYRNKAQYPIGTDRDGNVITGFYAGRTHTIIANTDCALGASENQQILETILSYMRKNKVTAYDEVTGKGLVRHVLIRKGFTSGQLMVCLVINKKMTKMSYPTAGVQKNTNEFLPNQGELLAALAKIQGMTSVSVSINAEKTNVIMGTMIHNLWGESTIEDTIHVRDMQKLPLYRGCINLQNLSSLLLSGKSHTDREALQPGTGICGTDRKRDRLGSLLWYRNHLSLPGGQSQKGVWRGDHPPGHRRCQRECKEKPY